MSGGFEVESSKVWRLRQAVIRHPCWPACRSASLRRTTLPSPRTMQACSARISAPPQPGAVRHGQAASTSHIAVRALNVSRIRKDRFRSGLKSIAHLEVDGKTTAHVAIPSCDSGSPNLPNLLPWLEQQHSKARKRPHGADAPLHEREQRGKLQRKRRSLPVRGR